MVTDGGFDAEGAADVIMGDMQKGLERFAFVKSLPQETVDEVEAILLTAARSYRRRVIAGGASPVSMTQVREELHAMVEARLVQQEKLFTAEEWNQVLKGFQVSEEGLFADTDIEELVVQLRRLFPNSQEVELMDAARQGRDLATAADIVMATPSLQSDMQIAKKMKEAHARIQAGKPKIADAPPAVGDTRVVKTMPVNAGSAGFGLFFDLRAGQYGVEVTALRSGSGAGLNWGAGGAIPVDVFVCEGSARGVETQEAPWRKVGGEPSLRLPMLSWMEPNNPYGVLPLDAPIPIAAGQTIGVCVRTGDVNGLALRVDKAMTAGDTDFLDDDFGGGPGDDDVSGRTARTYETGEVTSGDEGLSICCGYSVVCKTFSGEPTSPAVTAAFVGEVEYRVVSDAASA